MMSANITAASTPWTRTGSSVTSAQSSGWRHDLEEAVPLADLAVAGQRAPGLPHEPDGRPLDRLEASRSDQQAGPLELSRELVVDAPEDKSGDHQGADPDTEGVDDVAELRKLAEEERVANRLDERSDDVAVVEDVGERSVLAMPGS